MSVNVPPTSAAMRDSACFEANLVSGALLAKLLAEALLHFGNSVIFFYYVTAS